MAYIKADSEQEQQYFDFLEDLRQSGDTNMFGARPYLLRAFRELTPDEAGNVLGRWMKFHEDKNRILDGPLSLVKTTVKFETRAKVKQRVRRVK